MDRLSLDETHAYFLMDSIIGSHSNIEDCVNSLKAEVEEFLHGGWTGSAAVAFKREWEIWLTAMLDLIYQLGERNGTVVGYVANLNTCVEVTSEGISAAFSEIVEW